MGYTNTEIDAMFDTYQEILMNNNYGESLTTSDPKQLCNIEGIDYIQITQTYNNTNVGGNLQELIIEYKYKYLNMY
jgi:hypothetical protein